MEKTLQDFLACESILGISRSLYVWPLKAKEGKKATVAGIHVGARVSRCNIKWIVVCYSRHVSSIITFGKYSHHHLRLNKKFKNIFKPGHRLLLKCPIRARIFIKVRAAQLQPSSLLCYSFLRERESKAGNARFDETSLWDTTVKRKFGYGKYGKYGK